MKYSSKTVCAAEVLAVKNTFSPEWDRDFSVHLLTDILNEELVLN